MGFIYRFNPGGESWMKISRKKLNKARQEQGGPAKNMAAISGQKSRKLALFVSCFFLAAFLYSQDLEPVSEAEPTVLLPLSNWNALQWNWSVLKENYGIQSSELWNLQQNYMLLDQSLDESQRIANSLKMNLGTLELRLQQSEQASASLTARIRLSKTQLETLTESLAQQTRRTASLEKQLRFYKTGFYITAGVSITVIGTLVLINTLR
jgi:hypothetical protein